MSFSPNDPYLAVLRARYPKIKNPDFYYDALCKVLAGLGAEIDWESFTSEQWDLLARMADWEQVSAVLYWLWRSAPPPGIPKEMLIRLSVIFMMNEHRQKQVLEELKGRILPALEGKVSPVVILKGEALAYSVYPHPALRPMGDLDMLVREDQQAEAVRCLEAIGYIEDHETLGPMTGALGRQHHAHLSTKTPISLVVEVHQNIMDSQSSFSAKPNLNWFWENLAPVRISEDFEICSLNPTAQLLHLANHLALQHGEAQMGLLKYYDLHLVVEKYGGVVQWEDLASQAKVQHRSAALFTALRGCVARFDTKINPDDLLRIQSEVKDDLIAEEVRRKSQPEAVGSTVKVYATAAWFNFKKPAALLHQAALSSRNAVSQP